MIKQLMVLIVFLLLIYITFLKNEERFNEIIKLSGDFYIPDQNNIIDFRQKSINSHRVCIYDDSDPNNVELECIDSQTLLSALKLPMQRKTEICIDDVCLNKKDIEVLNGNRSIKLKSKDTNDYTFYDKCAYQDSLLTNLCGVLQNDRSAPRISTIKPLDCNDANSLNFVLEKGKNEDRNAVRKNYVKKNLNIKTIKELDLNHH